MPPFAYRDGVLHAEGVALDRLAAEHGTPAYVYSTAALETRFREWETAFAGTGALICYALKAVPRDPKAEAALRELNRRLAAAKKAAGKKK